MQYKAVKVANKDPHKGCCCYFVDVMNDGDWQPNWVKRVYGDGALQPNLEKTSFDV